MLPRVSIIILNYNGWKDTIECLESLYKITYPNYDVIVVDNGSNDDSVRKIKEYAKGKIKIDSKFFKYDPRNKPVKVFEIYENEAKQGKFSKTRYERLSPNRRMILIKNENNYGFTGGNNIGINFASKAFYPEYVLLLNNDTVATKSLVETLVSEAKREHYMITQPKIIHYDDLTLSNAGEYLDIFGGALQRGCCEKKLSKYDSDNIKNEFFYVSGACMLIDRELIKEFGNLFFDEKLFLYHEDVDVSWQCRLLNYKLGYVPKAVCYHKVGASAGRRSVRNAYYSFRNRIRVLIKNYGSFSLSVFLPLAIMIKMISIFGNVLLERNPQYFKVISSALWWNMKNISETLKERRRIQKMRRVSDRTIIKKMRKVPVEMIYFLKSTRW